MMLWSMSQRRSKNTVFCEVKEDLEFIYEGKLLHQLQCVIIVTKM